MTLATGLAITFLAVSVLSTLAGFGAVSLVIDDDLADHPGTVFFVQATGLVTVVFGSLGLVDAAALAMGWAA
jgi:hypothetical protein